MNASCSPANSSQVDRVKYLISKNYNILILINITNLTYGSLMLGNSFLKTTNHKKRVNKKR